MKFSECVVVNPVERVLKGKNMKKISMDKLSPYTRDVQGFDIESYFGGSKFRNKDTLMARITPCLENGKIAQVNVLCNDEVGFGSTEFIVFRAKEGITDPDFVYYLVKSDLIRIPAIKSMVGSSGRQRVQTDVIGNLEVNLPDLMTQKKIAKILSSLDDKIELNNRINKNLEEQAKALFKEFFIDNIESEKWKTGTFSNLIIATLGGDWGKDCPIGNFTQKVYCIRGADIPNVKVGDIGKMPTRYILAKNLVSKKLANGDIVIEISGGSPTQSTGRCMVVTNELLERYNSDMICTNFCRAIKPINYYTMFIYYYWQFLYDKGVFFSYENGTTGIKNLDINGFLESEQIIIPPENLILKFNNYCESIISKIIDNGKQNERLAQLRDTLLPKLMNGEIDVDKMEI